MKSTVENYTGKAITTLMKDLNPKTKMDNIGYEEVTKLNEFKERTKDDKRFVDMLIFNNTIVT